MDLYITVPGDQSAGIMPQYEEIHLGIWPPFEDEAGERARLRDIFQRAFAEMYDDGAVMVRFADECSDCGQTFNHHTPTCSTV